MKHKKLFLIFVALATIAVCWFVTSQGQIVMDPQPSGVAFTLPITVFDSNSPWRVYETMPDVCDVYVYQDVASGARASNSITDLGRFGSLVLTAGEMTATNMVIVDINDDTDPPLFGDQLIYIPIVQTQVDAILDELLTGGSHRTKNSVADYIRRAAGGGLDITDLALASGTAQGGTSNTITLAANTLDDGQDNIFSTMPVSLTGGTGVGQSRTILAYNGTTNVATVDKDWAITPDATTTYVINGSTGSIYSDSGTAQAGDANQITLASTASDSNSVYDGYFVSLLSGTGSGQTRIIADGTDANLPSYNGTTKVAFTTTDWDTNPDSTSVYAIIPGGVYVSDSGGSGLTQADMYDILDTWGSTTTVSVDANLVDFVTQDTGYTEPSPGSVADLSRKKGRQ